MRTKLIATAHILLDTTDVGEADDAMSGLLTGSGRCGAGSLVLDWAYRQGADGKYQYAKPIEIPDGLDADDMADYIAEHERNRQEDDTGNTTREELHAPAPCGDSRLELLRHGLVCEFMGRRWRLLAGEAIEESLREGWRDGGDPADGEEGFLSWALEGDRLAEFLPAALGMDSAADEFWDNLRGSVDELLHRHRHEA